MPYYKEDFLLNLQSDIYKDNELEEVKMKLIQVVEIQVTLII